MSKTILIRCWTCGFYQSNGFSLVSGIVRCQNPRCYSANQLEWHRYRPGFSSRQTVMTARWASHKIIAGDYRKRGEYWYNIKKDMLFLYRPKLRRWPLIIYHTILAWWYKKIGQELDKSNKAQTFDLIKTRNHG